MRTSVDLIRRLEANIGRALVGKPEVVRLAVVGLLARGHLLIEDVPGVGKTTLAAALARSIGAGFRRIQFTSDMLPSDILGVSIYQPDRGEFVFKPGPIFANIVLADEINRTTPKTQSSLLEAMNEAQVSLDHVDAPAAAAVHGAGHPEPARVRGHAPLPESQLDRFLLRIRIGYPARRRREGDPARRRRAASPDGLPPVLTVGRGAARCRTQAERVRVGGRGARLPDGARGRDAQLAAARARREPAGLAGAAARGPGARARRRAATSSCPTTSRRWRCRRWPTA